MAQSKSNTSSAGRSTKDMSFKKRLEKLSSTVFQAEKNAEKQFQKIFKFTEQYRKDHLKKARDLISDAKKLKSADLVKKAELLRDQIEKRANIGMKSLMRTLDIPSKNEIEQLKHRISELEKEVQRRDMTESSSASSGSQN